MELIFYILCRDSFIFYVEVIEVIYWYYLDFIMFDVVIFLHNYQTNCRYDKQNVSS